MKIRFSVVLRVIISLSLLSFLLWNMRGHFSGIAGTLASTNLSVFGLATGLFMCTVLVISNRLKLFLAGEGLTVSYIRVVQLTYIGYFFNNFMPTAVGGDIVKAYYAYKYTGEAAKSFVSVFMDRFIGLLSFVLIAAVALLFSWETIDMALKRAVLLFALSGITIFMFALNEGFAKIALNLLSRLRLWRLGEKISKAYRAVHEYKNRKPLIGGTIALSVFSQSIYFLAVYMAARSLGTPIPVKDIFIIMPVVSVITMLPSLGGLGLREGAIVVLFSPIIGRENAFSVSVLVLAILLLTSLIGALIYLSAAQFRIKKEEMAKVENL